MKQFKNLHIIDQEAIKEGQESKFGYFPNERKISDHIKYGIIVLDKQSGPTSHEIVSIVKKILSLDKAGHSGTLDPNVTGTLPIALSKATKVLSVLLESSKTYICNLHSTLTKTASEWNQILKEYNDEIYQVPPLKSNVVKKLRKRRIYDVELIELIEKQVLLKVVCESGTYIRTLCIDLGKSIGSPSYMQELRRIKTGPFNESQGITLHQLFDAFETYKEDGNEEPLRNIIQPMENAIVNIPKIVIRINAIDPICHGSDLFIPGVIAYSDFSAGDKIAILSPKGELISLGTGYRSSKAFIEGETGKIAHPEKIFIDRDQFPKYRK